MSSLPVAVHTAAQVRALDRHAIDDLQIPSYTLMTRAGEAALDDAARWPGVRFGKIEVDRGGLIDFKRSNPWLAELDTLPFTRIYRNGELWKEFAGGGVDRLGSRLEQLEMPS